MRQHYMSLSIKMTNKKLLNVGDIIFLNQDPDYITRELQFAIVTEMKNPKHAIVWWINYHGEPPHHIEINKPDFFIKNQHPSDRGFFYEIY